MRLFRRIYTRVKDGSVLGEGGDPKKSQGTDAAKQCFACHQAKKARTTSIPPTFRKAAVRSATKPQYSANSMRPRRAVAKRRERHAPTHAIHARLSIGTGASWRDHEQNGRCTKELL
jgi:hypothetical protein